ncbi:MAG TPA: hypothetical protein VIK89_07820 [Cytophagaceae bacterium]
MEDFIKMQNQDEINYINKHFSSFFTAGNFTLKESTGAEIIFESSCAELIFSYDIRFRPIFEDLFIRNIQSGKKFLLGDIIEFLNPGTSFPQLVKSYTGEFGDLKMTTIQAYSNIVPKYLGTTLATCDFSWEPKLEEHLKKNTRW